MKFTMNYRPEMGALIQHGALDRNIGKEIPVRCGPDTVQGRVLDVSYEADGREARLTIEVDDADNPFVLAGGLEYMRAAAEEMGMSIGFLGVSQPPPRLLTDRGLAEAARAEIADLFKPFKGHS